MDLAHNHLAVLSSMLVIVAKRKRLASILMIWWCYQFNFGNWKQPTCSTLIDFLSFAQLSLIRKKMSALTLSLPFPKIECTPDLQSFIKSTLFFKLFKSPMILWVSNVGMEVCHLRHKIFIQRRVICCAVIFLRIPSPSQLCIWVFEPLKAKVN